MKPLATSLEQIQELSVEEPQMGLNPESQKNDDNKTPSEKLIDELCHGARHNKPRGWRRQELNIESDKKRARGKGIQLTPGELQQLWIEILLLEEYRKYKKILNTPKGEKSGKFLKKSQKNNDPYSLHYLVTHAWGLGKQFASRLKRKMKSEENTFITSLLSSSSSSENKTEEKEHRSIITDYKLAEEKYTASYLYAIHECREFTKDKQLRKVNNTKLDTGKRLKEAIARYDTLDEDVKAQWEMKRRIHLERQPRIKHDILNAMRKNPRCSWEGIAEEIDNWCSAATIRRYVTSRGGYQLYSERKQQMRKDGKTIPCL